MRGALRVGRIGPCLRHRRRSCAVITQYADRRWREWLEIIDQATTSTEVDPVRAATGFGQS
jgi:hypothetical protein